MATPFTHATLRAFAACALALSMSLGPAAGQQRGPIQLFPELDETPRGESPDAPSGRTGERPWQGDAPPAFEVEGLDAPAIDTIGLSEGSLGPDLWRGSDPDLVIALLGELPVVTRNPPLRDLTRRLLITGSTLEGLAEPGRLLEMRVERLLAMGDLASAAALLEQLPPATGDSALARMAADVALWSGNDERACALAADVAPTTEAAYWDKLVVHCRLREGDVEGARLALGLLREAGGTSVDRDFLQLAERIAADDAAGPPPAPAQPSAIHVAMLRSAGLPLPEAALANPRPILLAAAARAPELAPGDELELAERAFLIGALTAQELTARYDQRAPQDPADDVMVRIGAEWGPATRALAFQRVLDEPVPAARAEILDAAWRASSAAERILVANAFARPFTELPIEESLRFVAPSAAQALLAAERPVPAARWFSLLGAGASDERRDDARRLAPLFALAGFGGRDAVPEPDMAMLGAWRDNVADADAKAEHLYALLDGVGADVPDAAWRDLLEAPITRSAEVPAAAVWRALERADSERRRGETILFALHMFDAAPTGAFAEAVVRGLRGLRRVGLDQAARDIAVAAALIDEL